MSNQNETTLGKLVDVNHLSRDAIHIAVASVKAMHTLKPGQHIGFVDNTNINVGCNTVLLPAIKLIGIVDPFLPEAVKENEWFYMLLYPKTITGLKHVWTHPDFKEEPKMIFKLNLTEESKCIHADLTKQQKFSEKWLRNFALRFKGDYDEMIKAAVSIDNYCCFGDDIEYSDFDKDSEFWKHVEIVTGLKFSDEHIKSTSFRCAC